MCSICRQYPCHPMCPNYDPPVIAYCSECGQGITDDECMYTFGDESYHEDCFEEIAVQILIDRYGARHVTEKEEAI